MAFIEPMHRNKPNITYLLSMYGWDIACEISKEIPHKISCLYVENQDFNLELTLVFEMSP